MIDRHRAHVSEIKRFQFAGIADTVPYRVPRLLLNRDAVGSFGSRGEDAMVLGDIVESVKSICKHLGWLEELESLVGTEK